MGTPDGNLLLVGAYAPHEGHTVSDYNLFPSTLQTVLDKTSCKRRIILGDLNAKIARNTPGLTGKFGLHHYHSRNGRLLANFSQHNNLVIANSFFKSGRKGTHRHVTYRSHKQRNKRSELDLILIDRRWQSSVNQFKARWKLTKLIYGRETDHALLHFTYRTRIKAPKRRNSARPRHFQSLLSNSEALAAFNAELTQNISPNTTYAELQTIITNTMNSTLPRLPPAALEHPIFSTSTLALFEHRRNHWDNLTDAEKTTLHKRIKESCRQDYIHRLDSTIDEIAQAFARNNPRKAHHLINRLCKQRTSHILLSSPRNGPVLHTTSERLSSWKNYVSSLQTPSETTYATSPHSSPTPPTRPIDTTIPYTQEILNTMKAMKRKKALGPDGIPIDVIQRSPPLQTYLIHIIRKFWATEIIDDDFTSGDQLMIFKKGDRTLHRNFRPITLLNHSFKTLTSLINQRT